MKNIKLNDNFKIDLASLLETRLLVQANSGGGKSWLIRRLLEQSHGLVQQIVIDLEGEFSTLREKYDYVLVGRGGDTPATVRSAALLAHKLLELKVSAIIDLSELQHQERKRYVRLFLDAMIDAPKELWNHCMIVIDEAHQFAPEKGESEASSAVIDLCTRGRKRGFCAVLATQRISKLAKDAAAECNNKLIGRATQDIDMKRAAEELGFTSKEDMLSLRKLKAGEFYAFGTAMCDEPTKIQVGDVTTSHPKIGSRSLSHVAPPTAKIKSVLGQLENLPQEADKKIQTEKELKDEIIRLNRELNTKPKEVTKSMPDFVMGVSQWLEYGKKYDYAKFFESRIKQEAGVEWEKVVSNWKYAYEQTKNKFYGAMQDTDFDFPTIPDGWMTPSNLEKVGDVVNIKPPTTVVVPKAQEKIAQDYFGESALREGARKMLHMLVLRHPDRLTRSQLGTLVGFKASGGTFGTYVSNLRRAGLIDDTGGMLGVTAEGLAYPLGEELPQSPQERRDMWRGRLREGARKMFDEIVLLYPDGITKEQLGQSVGMIHTGGTFGTYLSNMKSAGLVTIEGGIIRASDNLF